MLHLAGEAWVCTAKDIVAASSRYAGNESCDQQLLLCICRIHKDATFTHDFFFLQGCVQLPASAEDAGDNAAAADLRDCFAPAVAHSDTIWQGCLDRCCLLTHILQPAVIRGHLPFTTCCIAKCQLFAVWLFFEGY